MMFKRSSSLLLLGFFLADTTKANHVSAPLILNDPLWPPFFYSGAPDQPTGFAKDIISICLDKNEVPFQFKFHPIKRMRVGMEQGLIDVNIYSYKKAREEFLYFGKEKIFQSSYVPFVRADSSIKINKISDFDPLKLGHLIGLRYSEEYYDYIQTRKTQRTLDEAPNHESNIRKLVFNRIDIFVSSKASTLYVAKQLGLQDKIKPLDYVVQSSDYFFTLSKKSPRVIDPEKLLPAVDQCLKDLKSSGTYCQIAKRYEVSCH